MPFSRQFNLSFMGYFGLDYWSFNFLEEIIMKCQLCGQEVKVRSGEEGTNSYVGLERDKALEEAAKTVKEFDFVKCFEEGRLSLKVGIVEAIRKLKGER